MRRSWFLASSSIAVACAFAATLASCSGNSNPAILPITTVDIDIADLLNGANLGCGGNKNDPYDVVQYATVLGLVDPDAGNTGSGGCPPFATNTVFAGASACFAHAVFSNLPALPNGSALPDGGSVTYAVNVYFYNNKTYDKVQDRVQAATSASGDSDASTLCNIPSTWMTTCTAVEQGNIAVNASCGPIVQGADAPDAGGDAMAQKPEASTKDATKEDAPDVGSDAPVDGAGDAPIDGDTDAGVPSEASTG